MTQAPSNEHIEFSKSLFKEALRIAQDGQITAGDLILAVSKIIDIPNNPLIHQAKTAPGNRATYEAIAKIYEKAISEVVQGEVPKELRQLGEDLQRLPEYNELSSSARKALKIGALRLGGTLRVYSNVLETIKARLETITIAIKRLPVKQRDLLLLTQVEIRKFCSQETSTTKKEDLTKLKAFLWNRTKAFLPREIA
jgi:hypothetical protein